MEAVIGAGIKVRLVGLARFFECGFIGRGSAGIHVKNSQTGPKLLMLLLFLLLLLMEIAAEATKWPISTKKSNFSPSI